MWTMDGDLPQPEEFRDITRELVKGVLSDLSNEEIREAGSRLSDEQLDELRRLLFSDENDAETSAQPGPL